MKKLLFLAILLLPFTSFASDEQIKDTIVNRLLNEFVAQVNLIDAIKADISLASNPAQFSVFLELIHRQLTFTTQEITLLLTPEPTQTPQQTPTEVPLESQTPPEQPQVQPPEVQPEEIQLGEETVLEENPTELIEKVFGENTSHYTFVNNTEEDIVLTKGIIKVWIKTKSNEHEKISIEFNSQYGLLAKSEVDAVTQNTENTALTFELTIDASNGFHMIHSKDYTNPNNPSVTNKLDLSVEVHAVGVGNPNDRYYIKLISVE